LAINQESADLRSHWEIPRLLVNRPADDLVNGDIDRLDIGNLDLPA